MYEDKWSQVHERDRCQIWIRVKSPIREPGLDSSWYEGIGPRYEILTGQKLNEFYKLRNWVLFWIKTHLKWNSAISVLKEDSHLKYLVLARINAF